MNANLFFLVERADYGCRCSWRQCHNVWRQISLRIDPIMCWINGGAGANVHNCSCRSATLSSVSEGRRRNLEKLVRDIHILLLTLYCVACKSKGKVCRGLLGVVMQSLRGQHRSSGACPGSIGVRRSTLMSPAAFKGGNLAEPIPCQVQR